MRIKNLRLSNFGPFAEASLDLSAPVTHIGGANGVGKSTILRAVAAALTGSCDLGESGRGLGELRRTGSKHRWAVALTAEWPDGTTETLTRQEGEGPSSAAQQLASAKLGIPRHHVRAALLAGELLHASDKDVQRLLLELADPGIELDAETSGLAVHCGLRPSGSRISLAEMEALYQSAYKQRREAGRRVDGLRSAEPPVEGLPADLADAPTTDLEVRLLDERRRAGAARADLEATRAAERSVAESARRAKEHVDAIAARHRESGEPDEGASEAAAAVEDLRSRLQAAEEAHEALSAAVAAEREHLRIATARMEEAAAEADGIKRLGDRCPTCRRQITPRQLDAILAPMRERWNEAKEFRRVAEEGLAQAEADLAAAASPRDLRADLAASEKRVEAERRRAADAERLATELTAATADRNAAVAEADERGRALHSKADAIAARLAELEASVGRLAEYVGARRAAERIASERAAAESERADLDRLCGLLGPDGLRKHTGGQGLAALEETINERLVGFTVELGPAARLQGPILVNGRSARLLSSSEQLRVGVGIQAAVARWTGLDLIVVDDLDRCLGAARRDLQAAVGAIGDECQVIVLAAVRDVDFYAANAAAAAAVTGWDFWLAESGDEGTTLLRLSAAGLEAA